MAQWCPLKCFLFAQVHTGSLRCVNKAHSTCQSFFPGTTPKGMPVSQSQALKALGMKDAVAGTRTCHFICHPGKARIYQAKYRVRDGDFPKIWLLVFLGCYLDSLKVPRKVIFHIGKIKQIKLIVLHEILLTCFGEGLCKSKSFTPAHLA